jgi:hypothetical protein
MFTFAGLSGRLSLESGLRAVSECKIEFACVVVEPSIRREGPCAASLDCFVDGLFLPRKSISPPVLFSGIEPSTRRPMDPSPHRHPRGSPVTSVLSTLPVVVTILLLLIFRPRDAISSTTRPCCEIGTVRCAGRLPCEASGNAGPRKAI